MRFRIVPSLAALTLICLPCRADLRLAALFSDHAVFQADMPIPVWGWADGGKPITVQINGHDDVTATAGGDRKWIVRLPAMPASSKPFAITVTSGDETIRRSDLLVGEV